MTRRARIALGLVGVTVVALAIIYVARPAGHVPPYDANLVRLAESDLQGYCAGETFWASQGQGNASTAAACRSRLAGSRPAEPDLPAVPPGFCTAIVDQGWTDGTAPMCVSILRENQLWPTYDGSLSDAWNRARPYPLAALAPAPGAGADGSRTGGRPGGAGSERTDELPRGIPRG